MGRRVEMKYFITGFEVGFAETLGAVVGRRVDTKYFIIGFTVGFAESTMIVEGMIEG